MMSRRFVAPILALAACGPSPAGAPANEASSAGPAPAGQPGEPRGETGTGDTRAASPREHRPRDPGSPGPDRGEAPAASRGERAPAGRSDAPPAFEPLVNAHNRHRARHCAPPLSWSPELAATAGRWAETLRDRGCALEHSRDDHGENLAAGTPGALGPERVADMWYREVDVYDFGRPRFSFEAGHFTQLVWVATREIGCARTRCPGLELWVCNYTPAGNIHGAFRENVLPRTCQR